ncbi:hypothetical protein AB0F07_16635 [Streptomyces fructofermentans]|uniref:hypothetical protein n=1 Tax=Streptomyces fructofermentans TaxID=152141 RepID=UPI0033FEC434
MSTLTSKEEQPERPADLERARLWLTGHGLPDVPPTALLAKRLAVRQNTRLASQILLAVFIVALALVYTVGGPLEDASGANGPYPYRPLLLLALLVAAFVSAQALLDRRVRHVDRQAAAGLRRRAAHPVHLGWRAVLGPARAALAATTFGCAIALTAGALAASAPGVRYAAGVLLVGLCAAAAVTAVQLRHVLTSPAVADDEPALTADALLRIEDAREVTAPTMVWCMPWYIPSASMAGTALVWWNVAWFALIAGGAVTLVLITLRTARGAALARRGTTRRGRPADL